MATAIRPVTAGAGELSISEPEPERAHDEDDHTPRPWLFKAVTLRGVMTFVGGVLVVALGFGIASGFVEPPPPSHLTIATGAPGGAYHDFAQRYKKILERENVELEVIRTEGSVENVGLLREGGADVALVQGGVLGPEEHPDLASLGALFYEPLWLFYRGEQTQRSLLDLAGKRIAIGPEGSGTRALMLRLLSANGMDGEVVQLSDLSGAAAAEALLADKVDAVAYVASVRAGNVQRLLREQGIRVISMYRAAGYAQRFEYLSAVTLHEGAIDLGRELPREDVHLVAPVASLIAGPSLHPALVSLLLQAADEVHQPGGLFEAAGEFPAPTHLEPALHDDARRYYERGVPILQRYMPFWVASFLDRMVILLIPLLTLAIPLMRILPPIYQWRMRGQINRWYREIARVELDRAEDRLGNGAALAALNRIEAEVAGQHVGIAYADAVYALRLHINYIRQRLSPD
ncbi:MAG: TAXI family TRAP transporter solute-binding subunit [Alphaproteobacteria bacterium]